MKKSTTFQVLAALSIIAAIWECVTILNSEEGDTFSATIRQLGIGQPLIPFMAGMLSRHLWGNHPLSMSGFLSGFAMGDPFWPLKDGQSTQEAVKE